MSEYKMTPAAVTHGISLALGFALMDARASRLGAKTVGYVERAIVNARARMERHLAEHYTITD